MDGDILLVSVACHSTEVFVQFLHVLRNAIIRDRLYSACTQPIVPLFSQPLLSDRDTNSLDK